MNQVTILKKLKDCQNIIHFYGLTYDDDGLKFYLVTEWAEHKNLREYISSKGQNIEMKLRLRFAYDIAKGLNFLNSVRVINSNILFNMSKFSIFKHYIYIKKKNFSPYRSFIEILDPKTL